MPRPAKNAALSLSAVIAFLFAAAGAFAADLDSLPNPLAAIRPGQWVEYRHNLVFGMAEQRQKVLAVEGEGDERVITIESVMTMDGEVVDERVESITYGQALLDQRQSLADAAELSIAPAGIRVKDGSVDGVKVEFVQDDNRFTLYLSDRIPITGVARMEVEGVDDPVLELVDFGE